MSALEFAAQIPVKRSVAATFSRVAGQVGWRPLFSFVAVLALWQAASAFAWVDPRFLPAPGAVALRAVREFTAGSAFFDLSESLRRNLTGFAIGAASGIGIGLVLGVSDLVSRVVGPTILGQRQTALFAWVPLLSMWFGGGDAGKIAFIAVAAFQPVVVNTWAGVQGVPRTYRELSAVLLFSRLDYFRFVALPAALPAIFTGLKAGLIVAWLATVGSELFLNIAPGLGGRLVEGSQLFDSELLLLTIIVLGVVGVAYMRLSDGAEAILLRGRSR